MLPCFKATNHDNKLFCFKSEASHQSPRIWKCLLVFVDLYANRQETNACHCWTMKVQQYPYVKLGVDDGKLSIMEGIALGLS